MKRKLACLLVLAGLGFGALSGCSRSPTSAPAGIEPAAPTGPTAAAIPRLPPPTWPALTASPTSAAQNMQSGRGSPSSTPSLTPSLSPTPTLDLLACLPAQTTKEVAQVQWASTGDTMVVALDGRLRSVRYLGITAPAYVPNIRFMGPPAYLKNRELVMGQTVELYRDGPDTDELGQLLRYVVTHGLFVNLELVRLGLAQVDPDNAALETCAETFLQAEQSARAMQVGLWSEQTVSSNPTAGPATRTPAGTPVAGLVSTPRPVPSLAPFTSTPAPSATVVLQTAAPSASPTSESTSTSGPSPTPSLTPTATPSPSDTPIPAANTPVRPTATTTQLDILITDVNFDGQPSTNESDEYVEITNDGRTEVNLLGWKIVSENTQKTFTFPSFVIQPEVTCYIYTNQIEADSCVNDSFRSSQPIWSDSDCAQLYDSTNHMQDEYCY